MTFCAQCGGKLIAGAAFCGSCGHQIGAQPSPYNVHNENDLIERARAAQVGRDRQAAEERDFQRLEQQSHELTLAYMRWWAKRFPALANKVGLPYSGSENDKKSWLLVANYGSSFHVTKRGELALAGNCQFLLASIARVARRRSPPFSEAEMRQRVDKLFEDALMGNPDSPF